MCKNLTNFRKTGHFVIGLHSNAYTKDYDHSLMLVSIGRVFDYQMMTNGGHVYPILSKKLTFFKNNYQATRSI
jgi:hypothetical protein